MDTSGHKNTITYLLNPKATLLEVECGIQLSSMWKLGAPSTPPQDETMHYATSPENMTPPRSLSPTLQPLKYESKYIPSIQPLKKEGAFLQYAHLPSIYAATMHSYNNAMKKETLENPQLRYNSFQGYAYYPTQIKMEPRKRNYSLLSSDDVSEQRVAPASEPVKPKKRLRKATKCGHPECPRVAVSRGRCVRHGGGSRCTFPNCPHGARLHNRCFHHGGCNVCKVEGCESKAKRYGFCWSHGGGHICDSEGCTKVAAPGGRCWAHGGGNRCKIDGCNRRSYQKYQYLCKSHHVSLNQEEVH